MERPVFLNLTQIEMPVGAVASIAHRISGVLLAAGLPLSIYMLGLSVHDAGGYARVAGLLNTGLVKVALVLLAWALGHHAFAGIRHLLSDIDVGSSLTVARRSAWMVNVGALVVALVAWVCLW